MPRIRLLAPVALERVAGAAGDVLQVDGALAHDLISEGLAVIDRGEPYAKAVLDAPETTSKK